MQFQFLQDHVVDIYNNLYHFLEITLHFHFTTPSRVMLKIALLASTKLSTAKSLSPFVVVLNYLLH